MSRLDQIRKMLESEPDDVFLNFGLAVEYAKQGQVDEALAQFDRLHQIDANYVPAYFQRGNILLAHGRTEDAKAALMEGIRVAQRTGDLHAAGEMQEVLATLA